MHKLFSSLFVKNDVSQFKCDVCKLAKCHRASLPPSLNKSYLPFMTVHSVVWGPCKIGNLSDAHGFGMFIDDYTQMTWVRLLKSKREVNLAFQKYHT